MIKSPFDRFITDPRAEGSGEKTAPTSTKIVTVANGMTAARPVLASIAANKLIHGEKGALPWALAAAASDAEGNVARLWNKVFPDSERGTTIHGAVWDPRMDTVAALILCGAILKAPRVSPLGKAAVGIVLGQEGAKTAWAINADVQYRALTEAEEHLWIQPTKEGKAAMAEKLTAICFAVATNETDNFIYETALGASALAFGTMGSMRAEQTRRNDYVPELAAMMEQATILDPTA